MTARPWIAALILATLVVTPAAAATLDWEKAFRGSTALTVAKLEWSKTPVVANRCPAQGDFRPLAQTTLRGRARQRLADLLLAPEGFTSGPDCGAYCLSCPDQLAFEVDVEPDRAGISALILLRERRVLFQQGDRVVGSRRLGDADAAAVLDRIEHDVHGKDTLPQPRDPDDGALQDTRACVFVDRPPVVDSLARAVYPDGMRSTGVEGRVVVRARIGSDGRVRETSLMQSIPILDGPALDAVRASRFRPALCGGHPVAVWFDIPFDFKLH